MQDLTFVIYKHVPAMLHPFEDIYICSNHGRFKIATKQSFWNCLPCKIIQVYLSEDLYPIKQTSEKSIVLKCANKGLLLICTKFNGL